ncbi:hypothetical protein SAMN04488007_3658 [Maribacter aquivivus]|uniref:Fibronectin type-III domain-containing protein n=1 Tax=Maribacter aquivivus TaxID=228958 RepID=A0A1M6UIK4_9FLAO|nr:hypothetical protein [Maribacter aquivivus]SHK68996.1 hypothetical protein SAMN04488007_3658 [Maribacter aquivivus]
MEKFTKVFVFISFLFGIQTINAQCPNLLENQATGPNSISFLSQSLSAGADSAIAVSDAGECGLTIVNNDANQPWAKYLITIDLTQNGLLAGDELITSIEVQNSNGQPRIEYNQNNTPNTALAFSSFSSSNIFNSTFIIPSDINTIDIWLFSNYTQNTPGSVTYKNLNISKVATGGGDTSSPVITSFTSTTQTSNSIDLSWSATDDQGSISYSLSQNGQNLGISTTATSYQSTGLTAETSYSFTLSVTDTSSNTTTNSINVTTSSTGTTSTGSSIWTENNSIASYVGKVGIGTSSPGNYELAVNGNIRAKEVKVETANWPDYVFDNTYVLPSLEEVQQHIAQKGHLPNIPSAKEIESNGLELGEMNRLLLEKIEEIMLYTIQQQKEIEELKLKIQNNQQNEE